MVYSNAWKKSEGAKIAIGATTYEDAVDIQVSFDSAELVDITTLGSSRKEYSASSVVDAPEGSCTVPFGTLPTIGGNAVSYTVTLPLQSKSIGFSAITTGVETDGISVGGKVGMKITFKPTTAPTIT
jgi:hypothetical protein